MRNQDMLNYCIKKKRNKQTKIIQKSKWRPELSCFVFNVFCEQFLRAKLYKAAFTRQTNAGQLVLANSDWCVCVCERYNNMLANCCQKVGQNRGKFYLSPTVCQHVVVSFTHTNLSLPTRADQHQFDV